MLQVTLSLVEALLGLLDSWQVPGPPIHAFAFPSSSYPF